MATQSARLSEPGVIHKSQDVVGFGPEDLVDRTIYRRVVEAVIWGMPVVNFDLMYQATARNTAGTFNQITYWSRLPDWKIQTLTPNPDAIYFVPYINTNAEGPMVLEIPPDDQGSITGTVMDCRQAALEDVVGGALLPRRCERRK